jgi:molybdopterin biosynthesis enzyme
MILGQDLTRVTEDSKGVAFKKGHIISAQDIPMMLSMGKDHVYVMKLRPGAVHENEAAQRLAAIAAGAGIILDEPSEGKVNLRAGVSGLLAVDRTVLTKINCSAGIAVSTLHDGTLVREGQFVASAKIIPLTLPESTLRKTERACIQKIIGVRELPRRKVGLIVTGSEVYYGRIQDRFEGIVREKVTRLGSGITDTVFLPDDRDLIAQNIVKLAEDNDLVFLTGGMSVDPDDVTPAAVRKSGAKVVVYGTPVLPGAMFLLAYRGQTPVIGIPACGMFSKITILDVVLPRVLLGERINRRYIASLGHGGLCQACSEGCRYPTCSFCK